MKKKINLRKIILKKKQETNYNLILYSLVASCGDLIKLLFSNYKKNETKDLEYVKFTTNSENIYMYVTQDEDCYANKK